MKKKRRMAEITAGLRTFPRAHRAIIEHRLWPFMLVPGIMSAIYLMTVLYFGGGYLSQMSGYIIENWIPGFLQWRIIEWTISLLLWIMLLLTVYVTYQPVILTLFSPILGFVSEIAENRIYNRESPPFLFKNLLQDILRSVGINLRNLTRMAVLILLAWMLILLPVVGSAISAVLIFLIQAYYGGFSLSDYTLERKRFAVKDRVRFVRSHRHRILGVGIGFMGILVIPVLGWFAAPSYGTVAATLAVLDLMDEEREISPQNRGQ